MVSRIENRLRVLFLEDNRADLQLSKIELLRAGFDVESDATDGAEAFKDFLEHGEYDVIIADYRLPGWTGMDAMQMLEEQGNETPLILLTGSLGDETAVKCIKAGARDYVLKENLARLPHAVGQVLKNVAEERLQKRAAEELIRSRQIRVLANAIPGAVWSADATGATNFFNDWWLEYTGLTPEESLGRDGLLTVMHPDDVEQGRINWAQAVHDGDPYENEYRFRRALDGVYRWHLVRGVPQHDPSGKIVCWFGTCTDIEDFKQAQCALLRSEKLASVGRMASTIAHEINNPLETIGSAIYLTLAAPEISEQTKSYLKIAVQELDRVTHIARQTLAFHRETSTPTLIDLRESIDSMIKLFASRLKSRGVAVGKRCPEVGKIMAFGGDIQQVISNLLSNSMDATPDNGRIEFRLSRSSGNGGDQIRFTIADTGSGIPPKQLSKVFEPFFTTKEMHGTGLGLWVTKQIVEKHGATIRVRSKLGNGTVCSIVFPAAAQPAQVV